MKHRILIFLLLLAASPLVSNAQKAVPDLMGLRLHDEAHVLSASTVDLLERKLKIFEDSTSNQMAILTINTLDGESIEQYGIRVAEQWKLGTGGRDNGIILLFAIDDHKARIEVGQGLEGPLPDITCNQIIRNEIAPNFRRNDYDAGVNAAVDAIAQAIKGEYKADTRPIARRGGSRSGAIIVILIIIVLFRLFANRGGRSGGWTSGGGMYYGGGGGSWGGGGGGGFSGGGGSFGGGGSSGSW
jgi:uncharacterized protein